MKQLTPWDMHMYQVSAVQHGLVHPQAMWWMDMGLGKTTCALTVVKERMERFQVYGTLVGAPLRVCQTVWEQESHKWTHTDGLTFNLIHGNLEQRCRAAMMKADVYLVNYENMVWLIEYYVHQYLSRGLYPPFNMLVLDEVTKMKDAGSKRHHALRKILPYLPYRLGLTGTPAANGYLDLFGQYLAIDSGDRLGTSLTDYKRTYFTQGFMAYQLDLKPFADEDIQQKIKDITLQMDAKDYLELPEVIFNDIYVDLPAKARKIYAELERDLFMELDNGIEIEVHSNAALSNKCLQAASGCVYDEEGLPHEIHKVKLEALDDVYEEAAGQPLLVLVQFKFDIDRIMKRYPDAVFFGGSKCDPVDIVRRWDAGQIRMLVGHPASMGHGLNLQYGGHIGVWFGMNWSLDLVLQANARLDRQGQKLPVIFHRILTRDTLDMMQLDALENKAVTQTGLRQALKRYRHGQ